MPEEEPLETCEFGCSAGDCLDSECTPNAGRTCSDGNVYGVDSCEELGELLETCTGGCADGECVDGPGPEPEATGSDAGTMDSGVGGQPPLLDAGPSAGSGGAPTDSGLPPSVDAGDAG